MINLISDFKKMALKEIKSGITPLQIFVPKSSNLDFENSDFPKSLNEFYQQVDLIEIKWGISEKEERRQEVIKRFDQDLWLEENYDLEDFDFDEHFSGRIKIQKLEDVLNPEFCKEQGYYSVIEHSIDGENPDEYIPFDIHWTITACLKRENGKISDNIWLVNMEGRYMINMNVTIEKYLELCYKAKGFYHWQLVYTFQNEDEQDYQLMKRYLPMLFPEVELDLSDFGIEL